jgi:hypothetical protein
LRKQLLIVPGNFGSGVAASQLRRTAWYVLAMKAKKGQEASITQPLLKDLIIRQKVETKTTLDNASVGCTPLEQPDLYQDPGNGYNADFVFPQD